MEAIEANTTIQANTKTTIEPERPLANFPPSIWGDCFLSFSLDLSELEAYAKAIEEHKEELRSFIINPSIDSKAKLSFIYSVYRLGLTYLFMKEIEGQLDKLFIEHNMQDYDEVDLYTVSIHFQVFRTHGYRFSCDVFNKFKDCSSGTFKEEIIDDVRGMLSFYESAQLRIKGESILDEAFIFTESKLKSVEKTLEGSLARQVKYALGRPFHRGMPLVEARQYLLNYEEECSTYGSLLKIAKVHFNYLQLLHKEELCIVSQWWKDLDIIPKIAPYSRDRITELYLWILGLFMEPYYSQVRIITTKMIAFVLLLDDTYDAYATIDEIRLLTHAINRWEVSAIEQLPENLIPLYELMLNEFTELYQQHAKEGRDYLVDATKEAIQELARAYLQEAEWRHNKDVPLLYEYMKIGLTTSSYEFLSKSCLIGMGKIVTKEGFAWYQSHPKILKDSELIGRLHDDVSSFEFERGRGTIATGVEAYMKTFGVSEKIAVDELKKMLDNTWKDIFEGCLKPREAPMNLLAPIVNLARMADVTYKYNDGFTFPEKIFKEYITLLFQISVPV